MAAYTYSDIARMLDHSLLQQVLTDADLEQGCRLARDYGVASVCIKPYAVRLAADILAGFAVAVGTTIGFPHGGHKTSTGYGSEGATDHDLQLMRRCAPPHVQVKAAGGVRTFERLMQVRALGVSRVGATATRAILDECKARLQG